MKPVKPTENGNGNNRGATTPVQSVDRAKPVDPIKPTKKEFTEKKVLNGFIKGGIRVATEFEIIERKTNKKLKV